MMYSQVPWSNPVAFSSSKFIYLLIFKILSAVMKKQIDLLFLFNLESKRGKEDSGTYEMELKNLQSRLEGEMAQLNEAHSKTLEELAVATTWQLRLSTAMRLRIRKLQLVSKTSASHFVINWWTFYNDLVAIS